MLLPFAGAGGWGASTQLSWLLRPAHAAGVRISLIGIRFEARALDHIDPRRQKAAIGGSTDRRPLERELSRRFICRPTLTRDRCSAAHLTNSLCALADRLPCDPSSENSTAAGFRETMIRTDEESKQHVNAMGLALGLTSRPSTPTSIDGDAGRDAAISSRG